MVAYLLVNWLDSHLDILLSRLLADLLLTLASALFPNLSHLVNLYFSLLGRFLDRLNNFSVFIDLV